MSAETIQYWLVNIPLSVYIAFISGYLAYKVAYSGISDSHKVLDILMISIIFSSVATVIIFIFNELSETHFIFNLDSLMLMSASLFTLVTGLIWRKYGMNTWRKSLENLDVYKEDGSISSWKVLTHQNKEFIQAEVTLKNGTVLSLLDRTILRDILFQGLYFDNNGGLFLVVQKVKLSDGTIDYKNNVSDKRWGTSYTYIPASEICHVSFRIR